MGIHSCKGYCSRPGFEQKYGVQKTTYPPIKNRTKVITEEYMVGFTRCNSCRIVFSPKTEQQVDGKYIAKSLRYTSVVRCPCCHFYTARRTSKPNSKRREILEKMSLVFKQ